MEQILKILTTEDIIELKQSFKNIIIEQFKYEVKENEFYLFDPNEVSDMIKDAYDEVINNDFKDELKKRLYKLLDNNNIEKLLSLKKEG